MGKIIDAVRQWIILHKHAKDNAAVVERLKDIHKRIEDRLYNTEIKYKLYPQSDISCKELDLLEEALTGWPGTHQKDLHKYWEEHVK